MSMLQELASKVVKKMPSGGSNNKASPIRKTMKKVRKGPNSPVLQAVERKKMKRGGY